MIIAASDEASRGARDGHYVERERLKIRRTWLPLIAGLLAASAAQAQTDVLVSHYDDARTSANLSETTLTTANVNSASFGKVYALPVDGMVFAQPLFKSNLNIPGLGTFNTLFVATEHSSIYAIDADTATPLWHRSFINPAAGLTTRTTVPSLEDITPEVSITATPVIDAASGTMYVVAETQQSGAAPFYWLHALDITTGADKVPPVIIQASIGTGAIPLRIDAQTSQQRAGLVLANGVIYIGFGSSGDSYPWIGWLVGYDAITLARVAVFCTSTSGSEGAGVWSSGEPPPVDGSGNLFVSTGNGYFSPTGGAWANSILKLSTAGGLAVADSFTPFNQSALGTADLDLASAGMTLLPDSVGTVAHPHLMVTSGKDGEIYVLDRDNMGQYQSSYTTPNSQIVQWLPYGASSGIPALGVQPVTVTNATLPYRSNSYHSPAYWNNRVYFCGLADSCKLFSVSGGQLSLLPTSKTVATFPYAGAQPTISAASSAASTAILWAVQCTPDCKAGSTATVLHAYDATNLGTELYNSSQAAGGRDTGAAPVKFPKPTVANGRVFVPTTTEVDVYGLLASNPPRLAQPSFAPAAGTYASGQTVTISGPAGATIYYTLDGSVPTLGSSQYTAPLVVAASTTIKAMAVHSGSLTSAVASGAFTISSATQISYVQSNYATPQTTQTTVPVKYSTAQLQGDLNVVVVGWNDATVAVSAVTDTSGNTYVRAVGPTVISGTATQSIYYASNIAAAAAGANTVTVLFNAAAAAADVRILEYSGIATSSPLDASVGAINSSGTIVSSGAATTTNANDLIIGADLTTGDTTAPGPGFTARMITVPDADIVEDMNVSSAGSYSATAVLSSAAPTIMQMVAFKAAATDVGNLPSAPTNLVATATGAAGVSLSWGAASESGGTIAQYLIERCAGSSCTNFAQVNTATGLSFNDAGLTGSTSYRYRVRAKDASAHTGPYSNIAAATTLTPIPTAPTNLAATASGATQVNLSWGAASEVGGAVTGYLVERCQGTGCSNFTQVGSVSAVSYSDSGLSSATSYSYRVRATDAAANPGPYSNTASATTATASPTAPTALAVTTVSTTQLNLAWAAASESGGSIAGYFIERCQGAGCSSFVQVAGPVSGLTYSDTGLSGTTSYSYRVRARDGAGTNGPYSSVATGVTASAVPTAPTSLAATASGSAQIGLAWGAASEAGGTISQYLIERCQGAGCSSFAQVGVSSTLGFADTGLAGSMAYSYRVRAKDSLAVLGPYSNVSSATTGAAAISAPASPSATAAGASQIMVKWRAATESGGTISQYRIERCRGAGCTNFAQVGTAAGLSFADTSLAALTTYRYRIRAADAAGNVGSYSLVVQATTTSARHWWDVPVRPGQWTPFRFMPPLSPLR